MAWMIRSIRALFSWRLIHEVGAYRYYENAVTHKRRAFYIGSGYSPVNARWLAGADWSNAATTNPPRGGSVVKAAR